MTIRMKDIQAINDDLKKRKLSDLAKDSEKLVSTKKAVMQLAPTLLQKKSQGFTTSDLVGLLSQHQIMIKPRDLSRYLREYLKVSSSISAKTVSERAKSKQPAAPKASGSSELMNSQSSEHSVSINTKPRLDRVEDIDIP